MKSTDVLMFIAIIAVALATMNLVITINKIGDAKVLSGFATDTGIANLTIQSNAQINFTTDSISWGTGNVPTGWDSCELTTMGIMNCTSFTTVSTGLVLVNIGNENANLSLKSSAAASTFIHPAAVFQWNASNIEASSCANALDVNVWTNVTTVFTQVCSNFTFADTRDSLEIDLRVVIPVTATLGAKGVTITANADIV